MSNPLHADFYADAHPRPEDTLLVIEASGLGVNWMEPRDVSMDEAIEMLTTKPQSGHVHVSDGFLTTTYSEGLYRNVARCDGSVDWIGQFSDTDVAKGLLTVAGGEALPQDMTGQFGKPDETHTVVKWGKVYALLTLIAISLLPASRMKRRDAKEGADTDDVQLVEATAGDA